jgi:hypothetical protein
MSHDEFVINQKRIFFSFQKHELLFFNQDGQFTLDHSLGCYYAIWYSAYPVRESSGTY